MVDYKFSFQQAHANILSLRSEIADLRDKLRAEIDPHERGALEREI